MRRLAERMVLLAALACAGAAGAQQRAIGVDEVIAAPAAAWARFLADPAYAGAYDAFDALDEVGYDLAGVDPEACARGHATLEAAVRKAPVSIALHRARLLCAEALEDDATAEEALLAIGALARLALADGRDPFWPKPARVLGPADIHALLASSGLEYRYQYHPQVDVQRFFPLVVAVWDDALGAERQISFDYIDSAHQLVRGDPFSGYPAQRRILADAFTASLAAQGEPVAIDMQAVQAFRAAGGGVAAIDELRPGAQAGGLQSLATWLLACVKEPVEGCADGWVDALLPMAEAGHAAYMTLLSIGYATGTGVERDLDAAEGLLAAADRRWHGDGATLMFGFTWTATGGRTPPAFLVRRLDAARARGNATAPVVTAAWKLAGDGVPELDPIEIRALGDPANNGVGKGHALLVNYHSRRDEAQVANARMKSAADAGDPEAQVRIGLLLHGAAKTGAQREQALRLVELGAQGGNALGMRFLAHQRQRRQDWAGAEGWLLAAAMAGDVAALLDLAQVHEWEHPGVQGTREHAIDTYRSLADEVDSAEARRRLADMALAGRGLAKDPAQAERWLRIDAERGDGRSMMRLGWAHLTGEIPSQDPAEGGRWMERAIEEGHTQAYVEYGNWYFHRNGNSLDARRRGLELWRKGVDAGDDFARNNLAWALCTAPEPELFDAASGLELAGPLLALEDAAPAWIDTAAACRAAAGDHAGAVELQEQAMALLTAEELAEDAGRDAGYAARLALYRAGTRYVEAHRVQDGS